MTNREHVEVAERMRAAGQYRRDIASWRIGGPGPFERQAMRDLEAAKVAAYRKARREQESV